MKLSWRFGIIAGIFMVLFTMYPQMKMWYVRGGDWQGHYAYNDIDEVAYASYVKALIDGRPRKNDPYTGRDDAPDHPQPESLFSIQFAAPYTVAIPARILGIGAPWAMTLAGALAGFFAALACFWVIGRITGDSWFAGAATLVVLAGGALAAGEGAIGEILDTGFSYPYFPAFRRYIPAVPFAAFFAMIGLVWLTLGTDDRRRRPIFGALAALCFGYTVFSYFYTWTTAAAWLAGLGITWLVLRSESRRVDVKTFFGLAAGCLFFLAPYAYLLSKRSHTMDEVQLLINSRAPDLARVPEYIAGFVLILIGLGVFFKVIELRARETIFAISFALVPFIVFNQQVITGRELQPIHYQVFIGNYVAMLALVVTIGIMIARTDLFRKAGAKAASAVLLILAAAWGFVECHYTVRVLDDVNLARDAAMPVGRRLTELAGKDPDRYKSVILHLDIAVGDDLPTIAPQSVLWARHQHVFAGVTWQENKERYYQYLYFRNYAPEDLAEGIKRGDFVSSIALFGWGRHTDRLNSAYKPLTYGEVDEEARRYGDYIAQFDPRKSPETILSYAVVQNTRDVDLTNLDRFYERDNGEILGDYLLYRLKLR
ncbi:MAG: hypothetical protein IPN69_09520 [Acidobacteria bacterium]|nr:hypothetical protein [Acidobacteriota bacterium]MBK8810955.1 hypothetical protein [Acidobacteriota bacterium]